MNGRKVSDGQSVRVAVPENTTIEQGKLYFLGGFLGMAVRGVVTGSGETAEVILNVEPGEFETDQVAYGETMDAGTDIFWDNDAGELTETPTAIFAGKVTADRDENDVIWFKLAPQLPAAADAAALKVEVDALADDVAENQAALTYAVTQEVHAGVDAAATIILDHEPVEIVSVLAFVTATGNIAEPGFLAETTGWTLDADELTCVGDEQLNTLVITYKYVPEPAEEGE